MRSALAVFVGLAVCGCRATLPAEYSGPAPAESDALIDHLSGMPYVSADAGYRAVHALWKREPAGGDFAAVAAGLRSGGVIGDWGHAADSLLSRAEVGYMVCRAIDIRSGLNWRLTALGRYAWRELNYLGIASPPNEIGYVTGGQFVGILSRADDYRNERRGSLTQRAELGAEPG